VDHRVEPGDDDYGSGDLAGWWSRRITANHRIIYRIRASGDEQRLEIVACRYHHSSAADFLALSPQDSEEPSSPASNWRDPVIYAFFRRRRQTAEG
jgi:hypothetical protein